MPKRLREMTMDRLVIFVVIHQLDENTVMTRIVSV